MSDEQRNLQAEIDALIKEASASEPADADSGPARTPPAAPPPAASADGGEDLAGTHLANEIQELLDEAKDKPDSMTDQDEEPAGTEPMTDADMEEQEEDESAEEEANRDERDELISEIDDMLAEHAGEAMVGDYETIDDVLEAEEDTPPGEAAETAPPDAAEESAEAKPAEPGSAEPVAPAEDGAGDPAAAAHDDEMTGGVQTVEQVLGDSTAPAPESDDESVAADESADEAPDAAPEPPDPDEDLIDGIMETVGEVSGDEPGAPAEDSPEPATESPEPQTPVEAPSAPEPQAAEPEPDDGEESFAADAAAVASELDRDEAPPAAPTKSPPKEETKEYPASPKRRNYRKALAHILQRVNAPVLRAPPFWQRVIGGIALANALLAIPVFVYGLLAIL